MKILLLISEMWNDKVYPNNNLTNWFSGFQGVEIATISGGSGKPYNDCCKKYFQITDKMMAKSILSRKKAGVELIADQNKDEAAISRPKKNKIHCESARLLRDMVWRFGRYDLTALKKFIDDFAPDIIFSQRMGSIKMCRLEKVVCSLTDAPIVAYTGDDEYSLKRLSFNPIFWLRRFWVRAWLKRQIPTYDIYYSMSEEQMSVYQRKFGVETKFLVKCGEFDAQRVHTTVNAPIVITYAGKLYCGRWKTLCLIADAIKSVNADGVKIVLNVYTGDKVSKKQRRKLDDGINSHLHGYVSAEELKKIYSESDIALHVESFGLRQRLITKYSFSTKIMDCLSCGCAAMAVCHNSQAGFRYLKENDVAFTADGKKEIDSMLKGIADNPQSVIDYAQKAYELGKEHHSRDKVQRDILNDFVSVVEKKKNENSAD